MVDPKVLVYAGPNGSGKSTISKRSPVTGIYVNADNIKHHRGCTDIKAAVEAEAVRENLLSLKKSFTFETVLSTERNLILLENAKKQGYSIDIVFVLTSDAELNVKRVKARVIQGGHDVPENKIRSRYNKSLMMIKKLIKVADLFIIVDNTVRPEIIYKKEADDEVILSNEFWNEKAITDLTH